MHSPTTARGSPLSSYVGAIGVLFVASFAGAAASALVSDGLAQHVSALTFQLSVASYLWGTPVGRRSRLLHFAVGTLVLVAGLAVLQTAAFQFVGVNGTAAAALARPMEVFAYIPTAAHVPPLLTVTLWPPVILILTCGLVAVKHVVDVFVRGQT